MDNSEDDIHSEHSDTASTFWTPPATPLPNSALVPRLSSDSTASDNAHLNTTAYRRRIDNTLEEDPTSNGRPLAPHRRRRSPRESNSRWNYLPPGQYTATARQPPRRRQTDHTRGARNRLPDESSSSNDETSPDAPLRRRSPRREVQPDYEEFIEETEDSRFREQQLRELIERYRRVDDDVVEVVQASPPRQRSVRRDERRQANQPSHARSANRTGTGLPDTTSIHRQRLGRSDERRQANQPSLPRSANRTGTGLSDVPSIQEIAPDVSQPNHSPRGFQLLLRLILGPRRSGNDQTEHTLFSTHGLPNLTNKSATWLFYVVSKPMFLVGNPDRSTRLAIRDGIVRKLNGAAASIEYRDLLDSVPSPTDRGSILKVRDMLRSMNVWSVDHVTPHRPEPANRVARWLDRPRLSDVASLFSAWKPTAERFPVDDLDIYSLRDLGDIHIEWTDKAEEHLKMLTVGSEGEDVSEDEEPDDDRLGSSDEKRKPKRKKGTTLLIFWFDCKEFSWLAKYLCKFFDNDVQAQSFAHEIIQSWSFLFHHRKRWHRRRIRKEYENLPIPRYIEGYLYSVTGDETLSLNTLGEILDNGLENHIFEMKQHLSPNLRSFNASQKGEYFYGDFPVFGQRISKLRKYMDSRKPRGLWQLWKDNRDSLSYYTFWAAIIFGGVALVLALLSFAASVVQTWASVKALRLSQQSSTG